MAYKDRTWFELTVDGITARASNSWKGMNAIVAIAEAVSFICRSITGCPPRTDLGGSTMTFDQITGGYRPYMVPGSYEMWIDMRLVPFTDTRVTEAIMKQAINLAQKEVPRVRGHYIITGDRPYVEKDNGFLPLGLLKKTCDQVTGKNTVIDSFSGYTDTAMIADTLGSHSCMPYGPGSLKLAHKPNEFVPYEDVCRCREVLWHLVENAMF